jgi:Tfp pilus tip-associated adhesin PilY1
MRRTYFLLMVILLAGLPTLAQAGMSSYCSAPPYVTRSIAPNIMVLMDNSIGMMQPAYTGSYTPNAAIDNYIGYFNPTSCYSYGSNKFAETLRAPVNGTVTCTAAAPYRGNLMNWATMSKYDVLQKVLIGGNSTSKQANANTLLSIGGTFTPDKVFDGCIFKVNNANLTITEANPGDCRLLNNPEEVIAAAPRRAIPTIGALIGRFAAPDDTDWSQIAATQRLPRPAAVASKTSDPPRSVLATAIAAVGGAAPSAQLSALWAGLNSTGQAWAAPACGNSSVSAVNAIVGSPYTLTISAACNNCSSTFTWSAITVPAWLTGPTYAGNAKGATNVTASWTGTPTATGNFPFAATVNSSNCTGAKTSSGNIFVSAAPLQINQPTAGSTALPSGMVGVPYNYSTTSGQGGIAPRSWAVSSLPSGLTAAAATGYITGTPAAVSSGSVTFTLSDSVGSTPATRSLTLSIVANDLTIVTSTLLPRGVNATVYTPFQMQGSGGGGAPYAWSVVAGAFPAGIAMSSTGLISGTPTGGASSSAITIRLTDKNGLSVQKAFTFNVDAIVSLTMMSRLSPLAAAAQGELFTFQLEGAGGSPPYTWTLVSTTAPGLTMTSGGLVSWDIAKNQTIASYTLTVSMRDSNGTQATHVATGGTNAAHRIDVVRSLSLRSASFNVKVDIDEEPLTDLNGNDIWDLGETYTDSNANGKWDGKQGLFQKYWDANNPKARWGMTKFGRTTPDVATCMPASPVSSWYTGIQNATPADSSPLASGLYAALNYFGFSSPYGSGFSGCTNSDPIDNVPCRKNFILMITSGDDVSGTAFTSGYPSGTSDCTQSAGLVRNACVGYKTDLRSGSAGKQNVYTYVVNTMGSTNNATLQAAADAGGGKYYDASNAATLEDQLTSAFQDILSQAASGTAVSVLTTSSRGIGSMMQAYFLPIRQVGSREVSWTGYVQNIWIDPNDNLREDTNNDYQLIISTDSAVNDRGLKLYFDNATNETKAALFDETALASCSNPVIKNFAEISYTWEGGKKLALRPPSERKIFTSNKVVRGATTAHTFNTPDIAGNANLFTVDYITTDATLTAALAPDATYTSDNIVRYVRGECLETGVSGDTACGATPSTTYRDRRIDVPGGGGNGNVWKLGDVISSTPKVLSNTPSNSYHIDYGDSSYYDFITDDAYKKRSAVSFVGANDGMLHAFRVGYLKDKGLDAGILGKFMNFVTDDAHTRVGEEIWGYIPFNAFPYLKYLADPGYCHIYFNDLSVRLVDASLGWTGNADNDEPTDPRRKESWKTILVGGMRFGGACDAGAPTPPLAGVGYSAYYAIDVTDAEHPVPLWEFSDADMGYATGFPSIVRTGAASTNGNWYVVFGSGSTTMPKSSPSTDIGRSTTGYTYFVDLKTGALAKKIPLDHNAIVGDVLTIDQDKDYAAEKLYFGTAYQDGSWKGKLVSIDIPDQDLSSAWTPNVTNLFAGDFPITASPDATRDIDGNVWVYAGSGKYFSDLDEETGNNQIFLGVKDPGTGATYTTANLDNRTGIVTTGTVTGTTSVCSYDPTVSGNFGMKDVVTSIAQTSTPVLPPAIGWYVTLSDGERVISRPLAVGGLVDFLTYKPSADVCSYGGNSYLYALGYTTGVAPATVAIRSSGTTGGVTTTGATVTVAGGILLGPGAPPTGEAIIIPPPKEGSEQLKKKIQVATGVIVEAENTPVLSVASKIVHWLKK